MNSQIPPSAPARPVATVAPATSTTPVIAAAPVAQVSPELQKNIQPSLQVQGHVVASSDGEVRIALPQGEVVVKTSTPLPPDTDVIVDLYLQKTQLLADVVVAKEKAVLDKTVAEIISPPAFLPEELPVLQAGQKIVALLLPEYSNTFAESAPKDTALQNIAALIESININDIPKNILQKIPLPENLVRELLASDRPFEKLNSLPVETQKQVIDFFQNPAVVSALSPFIPAQSPAVNLLDSNLLQIATAQIAAKATQTTIIAPPEKTISKPVAVTDLIKTLLPFLQNAEAEQGFASIRQKNQLLLQKSDHQLQHQFLQLDIVSTQPPGTPPIRGTQPFTQLGTVESLTSQGHPIIKTDTAHLVVRTPVTLPVGSTVVFELTPVTLTQVAAQVPELSAFLPATLSDRNIFEPLSSKSWPALQETLNTVSGLTPETVTSALRNTLPTPTPKLVPTALFFLAALRAGNIESWLGPNILQTLRDVGKRDIADRLGSDFSRLSAQSKEPLSGEWRAVSLPMLHDNQLSQLQFFIRRQQDEKNKDSDDKAAPAVRFILNLNLSRMGDLQLDGLLRRKSFDVVLRTAEPLPFSMRQDLMRAFGKGLEQNTMQGSISFQTKAQHWVRIDLPHHTGTIA